MFPIKKNVILLRLENIEDNFDYEGTTKTAPLYTVSLANLANSLYEAVNGNNSTLSHINIEELSLSGN